MDPELSFQDKSLDTLDYYRSQLTDVYTKISKTERKEFNERITFIRFTIKSYQETIRQQIRIDSSQQKLAPFRHSGVLVVGLFLYGVLYEMISYLSQSNHILELTVGFGVFVLVGYFVFFLITLNLNTTEEIVRLKEDLLTKDIQSHGLGVFVTQLKQLVVNEMKDGKPRNTIDYEESDLAHKIHDYKIQLALIQLVKVEEFNDVRRF